MRSAYGAPVDGAGARVTTNGNGANRLGLYASIFMACAVVMSAFIWVGDIASQVGGNDLAIRSLAGRVGAVEADVRRMEISGAQTTASNCQQFAKVETQMSAVETVINKMNVDSQRDKGAFDLKLFGRVDPPIYYDMKIDHQIMPC